MWFCALLCLLEGVDGVNAMVVCIGALVLERSLYWKGNIVCRRRSNAAIIIARGKGKIDIVQRTPFGYQRLRRSYKLQGYPMADTAPMQAHASPQSKTAQTSRTLIPSTMERVCATDTAMDDKMHCQQTGGIGSYKMRAAAP